MGIRGALAAVLAVAMLAGCDAEPAPPAGPRPNLENQRELREIEEQGPPVGFTEYGAGEYTVGTWPHYQMPPGKYRATAPKNSDGCSVIWYKAKPRTELAKPGKTRTWSIAEGDNVALTGPCGWLLVVWTPASP